MLPPFCGTTDNEHLATKILAAAKSVCYESSLVHGKMIVWFKTVTPSFFNEDGILALYRNAGDSIVHQNVGKQKQRQKNCLTINRIRMMVKILEKSCRYSLFFFSLL